MSAFDTVYGSFVQPTDNYVVNDTLSTELPPPVTYDINETVGQPVQQSLATDTKSPNGISFSGALGALSGVADTGLGIFRQIRQLDMAGRSARAQQQIDRLNLDVTGANAAATLELQRARTDAARQVGIIQAQSSVDNARQAAITGRDGTYTTKMAETNWPILLGVGGLLYVVLKGAK